ncbi:MAG: VCBS repeat-containing protein, partial [Planctomycetota bacterium]
MQRSLSKLDSIFRIAAQADASEAFEVGMLLESLLRFREALGWYQFAGRLGGQINPATLDQRLRTITRWESKTTENERTAARLEKLFGFPTESSLSKAEKLTIVKSESEPEVVSTSKVRFRDVADECGIRTTFVSDYDLERVDFFLHQANGGGLGVIDYDKDGTPDLMVVQSGGDPNVAESSMPNQLFRQVGPLRFTETSSDAACDGRGYGQGVAVCDVNQDGWPDMIVANIGRNQLLINRGDGTFEDATETWLPKPLSGDHLKWTSSIGVGDLDGDSLPDLIEVNYVDDPEVFRKKCKGEVLDCVPQTFTAARDQFLKLKPEGGFSDQHRLTQSEVPANYGFGVVVADLSGDGRNEVFVTNDGDVNQYWRSGLGDESTSAPPLAEVAGVLGNAIGAFGLSEACMGLASGDFNRDGRCDLAVTNFYREPMNLFLQTSGGSFVDDAMRMGLDVPARQLLGFGCQASDIDNDGWLDLVVLNGHLYDFRQEGIPFRMPPQCFMGSERGFDLTSPESSYFERQALGRTLAVADFDGDGRMDFVANHLDAPVAVLRNESDGGQWIEFELVGTRSCRDAVGARVRVKLKE